MIPKGRVAISVCPKEEPTGVVSVTTIVTNVGGTGAGVGHLRRLTEAPRHGVDPVIDDSS